MTLLERMEQRYKISKLCRDIVAAQGDFSPEELKAYRAAELEFACTDRIYCADLKCGAFIPAHQRDADLGSCGACTSVTCVQCKLLAHDGICSVDKPRQELLEFARGQSWIQCFGCGEMIGQLRGEKLDDVISSAHYSIDQLVMTAVSSDDGLLLD